MDALDVALRAGVVLFMVGSLGGIGLGLAPRDALAPLTHGRFVALTLAASWLVCPAIAYLLLQVVPLDRPAIAAPVTLALSALTARWLARRTRALSVAFTAGSA